MKFEIMYQDHSKKVIEAANINLAAVKAQKAKKTLNAILTINEADETTNKPNADKKR